MKKSNLVKSLTRVINNSKGLLILCLFLAVFGVNEAWGTKTDYYSKATVSANPLGGGKVYVAYNDKNDKPSEQKTSAESGKDEQEKAPTHTYYFWADVNPGYTWSGWNFSGGTPSSSEEMNTSATIEAKADQKDPATITATATFTAHTYKVNFDGNGATGGSMNQQTLTYDQTSLDTNAFTRSYTVNFDADGGSAADTKTATYTFNNWNTKADGTGTTYSNQQKNLTTEDNATINLYAQWNSASITLPSSEKSGYVLDGWFSGDTKIGNPGDNYVPTSNVTLKAHWTGKYNPEFSYAGSMSYNVGDGPIDLQQLWISTGDGAITYTKTSFTPESGQQSGSTEPAITNNRYLSLNKAGTLKIHLEQAETSSYYAGNADLIITISRIANTLTAAETYTMKVDETWNNVYSSKNSDGTITTESTDASIAYFDVTNNKIVAQNSGQVTITIHQDETYKFTAVNKTITVTVNKWDNTLAWTGPSSMVWWSEQASVQASGNSDATISYSVVDERYGSYDAENHILYSHNNDGQLQVTATQEETYKYKGSSTTLTVNVSKANNHVTFTINSSTAYNNQQPSHGGSGEVSWSDGISFEQGSLGFNWDDNYVDLSFTGIPDKLSFTTSKQAGATDVYFYVKEYVNNSWSGEKWSSSQASSSTVTVPLSPNATKIRLCYSGNLSATFKNITVSELRTFSTSVNKLDFGNDNKVGVTCESQTFKFNYANVGHKVSLTTNDPQFTVEPSLITNIGGEQYGSQTITVKYKTDKVHSATDAKLTIADELGHSKEITLQGSTTKKIQTITWNDPYNVAEPTILIGKTISNAASAGSNLQIIYESSDESIIEILDDGAAFRAKALGSDTIIATQAGNDEWESVSDTVVFKATNKIIQVISWNQNFTRLLTTYSSQSLTARVFLEDAQTGVQTYNKDRSDLITYTSQNSSVVSVNGSTLTIVGAGTTTLTASVSGDELYESATVTIPVTVRVPSDGCEDILLGNNFGTGEHEFFHYSVTSDMEKVVAIDRTTSAIPGALSFQHKGKKWAASYSGTIVVYESTNNGQSWNYLGEITPTVDKYNTQTYSLNRNATHIKFFRGKSAKGYHYIKNVEISPAQFIESNVANNEIDFGTVTVNSVENKPVTLSYANVKDNLAITKSSSDLSLTCGDIIDLDCGATGTNTFTIAFAPTAVGDFSDEIQFSDKNSKKNYILNIKAKVVRSAQHITWEPTQTEYRTIDQIVLNATASSTNPVQYYVKEGKDVADFVNGVLTIKKDGPITIRAYEPGDALWAAAADVDKTFTIRKTNLHFDPLPTAATITYPQVLSESALTNGVVKDEDGKVVAGTIAWTNSTAKLNAGENQSQGIIFTPSANPAWYNALSSSVSVTVLKATPDATASAGDIVYGAKVKSSVLTNTGTTEGTWAWKNDEQNEKVLAVGTHEGLKVHFTPKDQTNYNEKDGTVSLTVTTATPTLTWTEMPETAQVHETKTFTASSTNTDSDAKITYSIISGGDCATINETTGEVTMLKAGTITVQASQAATTNFAAPSSITTTCTISKAPTTITTNPTVGDVVYGTALNKIELVGGVAQNTVNNQAVEGTFAITSGDISTAGEHSITVTFTPANTDMYAPCTKDISVTVLKATPDATASAGEIVYGAKVESSELTNTGTTDGTWTWTDDKKEQVLAVGTYEGLKVHFTPTDPTNYNEIDGTVSLTITAATPTLTWTAKAETAQVHEKKTFTASSTNTDSDAKITYSIISGNDCATINETTGEVTMLKAGKITVQASQAATTNFAAPSSITTTCTISQAPTTITTNPTVGDVVYGTALNKIELVGGVAQNTVNQQTVEGTFAITSGDISTAGEHSITVTFTPANTDMYAPCTKDISVTVQKADPSAIASAGNIVYGAKVKSSVLTNTGTTEGTWAWTDDKKEQELEVGTHEGLKVHFIPSDQTNYNEIDGTVSLTVKKAAATLTWTTAPTSADVKDQLTYQATSNHSESAITYAITEGNDCVTIDANTGVLTITKAGTITVQASQAATDNYEEATISVNTTLSGEFESVFTGEGDWNNPNNWTHGVPTSSNPDVVISGNMTIDEPISVGSLTIEANGSVTIIVKGDLTVNGKSKERDAYGDLFVHNGGNVTIGSEASVTVHDFVIEASIGTQNGTSQSGQVDNGNNVIYTNGAYIDINMDPSGNVDPAQWYGFTVPFQVDAKNGVSRKEGDIFRPCTYGVDYMIAEYDMNQRLSTGKGWKFISDYTLQAGHFYYLTVDGTYNTYRFKAKNNTITIEKQTTLKINGKGANANWNAVGNTTLTYATISGNDLPNYVQTYINGQSCYQVVYTQEVQFVVGCPFFFQATKDNTTMVLSKPTGTASAHYAPRQTDRPICVRIAEDGKGFSDQMYITASEDAQGQYQMGRDLAKAGIGTKSAQLWVNAYDQQLCVNDAPLVANQAFYDMSLFIPKAGNYEISLPTIPTNGTLYLTQDGYPIWNLNDAPYVLESGKGTISEYGLMFEATQAAAPTDVQTISGNDNAQKILKEQSIYIYKNGNIFNVTGQKVK